MSSFEVVGAGPVALKILIAHENTDRAHQVRGALTNLGHEVVRDIGLTEIASATTDETLDPALVVLTEVPDLAIVIVDESSERVLSLIARIVRESACPVIAILHTQDRTFVNEAAKLGIFAYITDGEDPEQLQSSIDISLRRFSEYHDLEGAFGRRAITERAKGILMERHSIGEREAFAMLRDHARKTNQKLIDVAEAVTASHLLLPASAPPEMSETDPD